MSTMIIQSGTLDDIADAIRAKTGGVNTMTPLEMPTEIASIPSGGSDIYSLNYVQTNMKFWIDGINNVNKSDPTAHEDSRFWATKYNNGGIYPGNLGSSPTWNSDNLEFTTRSTTSYARFNCFDYANIRYSDALTVECYVEYTSSSSGNNECISSCESGGWMMSYINGVPDFKVRTSADSGVQPTGNSETLSLDEKHLLTGTYDSVTGEQKFYIDGVLKGTRQVTTGATITNQTTVIWIGNDGSGGNPESSASNYAMIGKVYSARIYDVALTQAQIQQNYAVDLSRFGGNS